MGVGGGGGGGVRGRGGFEAQSPNIFFEIGSDVCRV